MFAIGSPPALPHSAAQGSKNELTSVTAASAAAVLTAESAHSQLLLAYASSSFADEHVCLRAKLLQLQYNDGDSSWCISTEADLLHPPSKDSPHFDVTCIIGHKVGMCGDNDCELNVVTQGLVFASDICGYLTCWALQPQLVKVSGNIAFLSLPHLP